jgi:hypothetical protein
VPCKEAFQRATSLALQVEVLMASTSVAVSKPHLAIGDKCWKTNLEAVGVRNLHLVEARI